MTAVTVPPNESDPQGTTPGGTYGTRQALRQAGTDDTGLDIGQSTTDTMSGDLTTAIDPDAVRKWALPTPDEASTHGAVPWAGTTTWARLADDDPRKLAAVVFASLSWCDQHTREALAERAEFDGYEERRTLRAASWSVSEAMRRAGPWQAADGNAEPTGWWDN